MIRKKAFFGFSLALILLLSQVMVVGAQEAEPLTENVSDQAGTVQEVTVGTDETTGETMVYVTMVDSETGETQTVTVDVQTAADLGLVTLDEEGNPVVNEDVVGQEIDIDPEAIVDEPEPVEEEKEHPVGSALAEFFTDLVGVDYDTVMSYHEDGAGFGTMAQALWMTSQMGGDTELFTTIMDAKLTKDYSAVTLPDGSTPQNWGQFKKALRDGDNSSKENMGAVMRDKDSDQDGEGLTETEGSVSGLKSNNGKGHSANFDTDKAKENKGKGKAKGKDKNKNK